MRAVTAWDCKHNTFQALGCRVKSKTLPAGKVLTGREGVANSVDHTWYQAASAHMLSNGGRPVTPTVWGAQSNSNVSKWAAFAVEWWESCTLPASARFGVSWWNSDLVVGNTKYTLTWDRLRNIMSVNILETRPLWNPIPQTDAKNENMADPCWYSFLFRFILIFLVPRRRQNRHSPSLKSTN